MTNISHKLENQELIEGGIYSIDDLAKHKIKISNFSVLIRDKILDRATDTYKKCIYLLESQGKTYYVSQKYYNKYK